MTRSGPNPVLAPIRRWVLYSRTNLVVSVVGAIAVLSLVGMVFGEDPKPRTVENATAPAAAAATAPGVAAAAVGDAISHDLDEVSESAVVTKTATWAAASAPATAMAYAHTFVDTTLSDTEWTRALGRYTADTPAATTAAARPRTPVVITGPTESTLITGAAGAPSAQVTVPTQAGDLSVSVVVDELPDGTQRWVVDTPLPTLDLSEVEKLAVAPAPTHVATAPRPTSTSTPTSTPTSAPTTSPLSSEPDAPESEPSRTVEPTPVPVPGPIPIPELDTPIPGQL
ncbi:hypothetical protein EV641_106127 [Rhodococcus sp. SMB37]|uniref:hypothetical protein n=1 Tax=Rhodococcus sp. SMB37 TaxID=2512213 RepID=UPI0010535717|nr:hypothetical protein [Rhodococcus sp. SMB37]TCN53483.1 hypothetical protein EV641_106127 [Rhodococcus sp. SMB37]